MNNSEVEAIIKLADARIRDYGWKVYEDNIEYYGNFVRLFYQSRALVETGKTAENDDDLIYGVGIFLVNLTTLEFHSVSTIEEIDLLARSLNGPPS